MTTQTVGHTPTPWKVFEGNGLIRISDEHGLAAIAEMITPTAHAHANAAFFVRACNSHDDLLATAKAYLVRLETMTTEQFSIGGEKAERDALWEAITTAEGKTS